MAVWRSWVFEARAPLDEFARAFRKSLGDRGAAVDDARRFDFVARAFGCRAFVKLQWAEGGIEAVIKIKSSLFASPRAAERLLLEAGREAQARVAPPLGVG